jgi:hypothetical protein
MNLFTGPEDTLEQNQNVIKKSILGIAESIFKIKE